MITFKFNKPVPSIIEILNLYEQRTGLHFHVNIENQWRYGMQKNKVCQVHFFHNTKLFNDVIQFYSIKTSNYYISKNAICAIGFPDDADDIYLSHFTTNFSYKAQVMRQILWDLGAIEELREDFDEEGNYTPINLIEECPIPDYSKKPWYDQSIPFEFYEDLREYLGWKRTNRPQFVSREMVEIIERGMPPPKSRPKK